MRFHPSPQPAMAYSFDRAFAYAKTVSSPVLVAESGLGIRSPFGGGASRTFVHAGLAGSIIDGVSQVLGSHGRVVVVEDDLLLSPHFLSYMNDGLALYADDERVASIHGYRYPGTEPLPETFFLRGADCWGSSPSSRFCPSNSPALLCSILRSHSPTPTR
jgi:hypothetical protein